MERAEQCVDRPSKRFRTERRTDSTEAAAAGDDAAAVYDDIEEDYETQLQLQRAQRQRPANQPSVSLRWLSQGSARSPLAPRISLAMFSAHRRWFRLNNRAGAPRRSTCLLDKWLYWSLARQTMDDRQLEDLVHSLVFDPRLQASVSPAAAFSSSSSSSSLAPYAPCNGSACFGFCCFLRRLGQYAAGSYSWLSSPQSAIADWADAPNHPVLILRLLVTEEAAQAQNCRLEMLACAAAFHPVSCPRRLAVGLHIRSPSESLRQGARQISWFTRPPNLGSEQESLDSLREQRVERFAALLASSCCQPPLPPAGAERVAVAMAVQANCSFERFLGYTQAELRQRFLLDGELALYHLIRPDCWERVMTAEHEARVERQASYSLCIVVLNRWGAEMSCLLHCSISFFSGGGQADRKLTFIPLATEGASGSCEQLNDALDMLSPAHPGCDSGSLPS